jgi:hypothetical protein
MDHRSNPAYVMWLLTWVPLFRSCPLVTTADWGHVPRPCPWENDTSVIHWSSSRMEGGQGSWWPRVANRRVAQAR